MKVLKIIFFGSPYYSVSLLEKIIELGHDVSLVVTQGSTKARRGRIIKTAVHEYCEDNKINYLLPSSLDDPVCKKIMSTKFDLGIVYAYGKLIPKHLIEHIKYGIMNLHCSLLPSYRGAAPIQHALINGDKQTGYTYFKINEKLDEGKIILQEKYKILKKDNCSTIQDSLTKLAVDKLPLTISMITDGKNMDNNESYRASYANKIKIEDAHFDWNTNIETIFNKIRALNIWPIARTNLIGEEVKILEADFVPNDHGKAVGKVEVFTKDELLITAQGGYLSIIKLQLKGKKVITNRDLYNSNTKFREKLFNNQGVN